MAKYFRPRRGARSHALAQNIVLKSGEMFLEVPTGNYIGKSPGRIILGDGSATYSSLNYATTSSTKYQPFITDPMLYCPIFKNSTYATSDWTVNAATAAINGIGDGSGSYELPYIIGKIKEALCKHEDSITALNNGLGTKQDSATAINTSNIASQSVNQSTYSAFTNAIRVYKSGGASLYSDRNVKCEFAKGNSTAWYYLYLDGVQAYTAVNAADWATNCSTATDATYATGSRSNFKAGGIVYRSNTQPCVASYSDTTFDIISYLLKIKASNNCICTVGSSNYTWAISAWSDERLKKNIKDTEVNGLDTINKIKLHSFDFIDEKYGDRQEIGYVAQEVKEIVPEMVIPMPVPEEDKDKFDTDKLYQIEDKSLIKYLVKAVQELSESSIKSHVGMIIHSSTLDTQDKVKEIYGGVTWIQHSGYILKDSINDTETKLDKSVYIWERVA